MRHGRAKAARKTLQYFHRTVGLKAPYSILLDATFIVSLFQQHILPVQSRLDRILQTTGAAGPNKYCVTHSAVEEVRLVHQGLQAQEQHTKAKVFQEALEWIRKECIVLRRNQTSKDETEPNENPPAKDQPPLVQDDILSHIQKDDKPYVIASQDEELLHELRKMGTVPIVRLANQSVLILEQPSKQSQNRAKGSERQKWRQNLAEEEQDLVNLVKNKKRAIGTLDHPRERNAQVPPPPPHQRPKRIKKAKGPNPLSCKRKQSTSESGPKVSASKKRRLRASNKKEIADT